MGRKDAPYPYSANKAQQNDETPLYRKSMKTNEACAEMIGEVIDKNQRLGVYNAYDLRSAVNDVIASFGVQRMNWVLANTIQNNNGDGRYSLGNEEWAKAFAIPKEMNVLRYEILRHPAQIDSFAKTAREVCSELHHAPKQDKPSILGQVKENAASIPPAEKTGAVKNKNGLEVK